MILIHYREETRRQEIELAREKDAADARLKDLQRQYEQGRLKKQEEKKRKQAAESASKQKETRLAAQRAELEAARERERKLQQQLEALADEDTSDDEQPGQLTPKDSTSSAGQLFNSQASSTVIIPPIENTQETESTEKPNLPQQASPSYSSETKNPFFKKINQSNESTPVIAAPASTITSPGEPSNNPFRGLVQQQQSQAAAPLTAQATGGLSRRRPEEDEWSVVDSSNGDSSSEEDEPPVGGSAKHLASMLFGNMGPPRPLSAADEKKSPATPISAVERFSSPPLPSAPATSTFSSPPPPSIPVAPPIPGMNSSNFDSMPSAPPPPPPPMPGAFPGASLAPTAPPPPPGPPPPPATAPPAVSGSLPARPGGIGAMLGDIRKGAGLRKVETKDRSTASVAGRVLD